MNRTHVVEVIDGERTVELTRWSLPVPDDGPALRVECAEPVGGATRPPVVLVHGFAQNRYTWRVSGRSFVGALVEAGHHVLSLELRGHGLSREAGSGNAESFEDYIEDVVRVVDSCPATPFLIGHSLGGAAAMGAATRRDVLGVVPLASIFTFATQNRLIRVLGRVSLRAKPLLGRVRLSTGWAGELLGKLYSVTELAGYGFPVAGWTPGSMERELLEERLAKGFDWTSIEVWLEMSAWANGAEVPGTRAFSALDVPLLVLVGDADRLVHRADADALFDASASTDKELVEFDAFHHEVHWGHVDLILGRRAPVHVWPVMVDWLAARS